MTAVIWVLAATIFDFSAGTATLVGAEFATEQECRTALAEIVALTEANGRCDLKEAPASW